MSDLGTIRPIYVQKYGKDAWAKAVRLATSHRHRASTEYGLTEHFAAWEWLDLCAATDFRCSRCGLKLHLEAHHRLALVLRGPNTIDNIEPVCDACHDLIPRPSSSVKDVSEAWKQEQDAVYSKRPLIGALVRTVGRQDLTRIIGVVTKTTAPLLEPGPLWGSIFAHDGIRVFREYELDWRGCPSPQARHEYPLVYVLWAGEEGLRAEAILTVSVVDVETAKAESLSWLHRYETVLATWHVGDKVRARNYSSYHPNRGEIEKIIPHKALPLTGFTGENENPVLPAKWVPRSAAKALVRWYYPDGNSKVTRIEVDSLIRLDALGEPILPKDE